MDSISKICFDFGQEMYILLNSLCSYCTVAAPETCTQTTKGDGRRPGLPKPLRGHAPNGTKTKGNNEILVHLDCCRAH